MGKRGAASAPATGCARALLANVIHPQRAATEPDGTPSLPQIVLYRSARRYGLESDTTPSRINRESSILAQLEIDRLMFQDSRYPLFMSTPRKQHRTIYQSPASLITNSLRAPSAQEVPTSPHTHPQQKPLPISMEQTCPVNFLSHPKTVYANRDIHSVPYRNLLLR